ncbi:ELO family [Xylogone sp. PMI_703]|nr:ELO family [Xylogone sp. PMI_703]
MYSPITSNFPFVQKFQLMPYNYSTGFIDSATSYLKYGSPFGKYSFYHQSLDTKTPLTVACIYATLALYLRRYNKDRGNKPWAVSKTGGFFRCVVAYNITLALFSAFLFVGFSGVLLLHGPQGVGNAARFTPNGLLRSASLNNSASDLALTGRLWSEGLAAYGWLFYLSKIYELIDTAILLSRGRSPTWLQIYHHTGAILCVWAGVRYMAAPLWSFIFMNSGIHTLMYTYYTLTLFEVRVPKVAKASLTTLQILQIIVAIVYGTLSLFMSYGIDIPLSLTRVDRRQLDGLSLITCVDTKGEAFAICLNVLYLLPLLVLFLNFFLRSYAGKRSGLKPDGIKRD